MTASLLDLVDNMSGRIFKSIVCKKCLKRENINSECDSDELKDNILSYKCRTCGEKWERPIEGLIRKFPRVYQFCKGDLNKFIWQLRKGVYPYEDVDNLTKFDETTITPKTFFITS